MADFFSDVQQSIPTDTFETLGITKDNVGVDAYVMDQLDLWLAGEADEPDLSVIWAAPDYGLALGTSGAIGAKYPDNPEVGQWIDRQKLKLAGTVKGGDPMVMNRLGTMWASGYYSGQTSAVQDELKGEREQPPPQPTPQPTPPQPGTAEYEIWEAEQRRQQAQGLSESR